MHFNCCMTMATYSVITVLSVLALFYAIQRCKHRSFLRNIPGPSPQSFAKGNLMQLFNPKGLQFHHQLVEHFGNIVKVYGFFGDQQLYISDPRALDTIFIKEPDSFEETKVFTENNKIIFGEGLVATTGDQHQHQRKITNPVFGVSNLRTLAPVFFEVAEKLADVLCEQIKTSPVLDMGDWMSRVALEMVGRTVLDYSFDPLDSPNTNPYTAAIKGVIPALFRIAVARQFAPILLRIGTPAFRRKMVEWAPIEIIQRIKHMSDVMYDTAKEILSDKRSSITCTNGLASSTDKDVLSVLLRENSRENEADKLTDDELIGQMTVLIFGASDTTSSAMSRILLMLAKHPDVQVRLRKEILAAQGESVSGRLGYEIVMNLPYLDAVIKESLRLYPPVPFVRRTTLKTTVVPLSQPVQTTDGKEVSYLTIPAGTTLFAGIAAANRLSSVWGDDACEWKPDRWLTDNETKPGMGVERLPSIYGGMMTFLAGPRKCIGYRFAQIEMKILLATLLSRLTLACTDDEIVWNLSQIISASSRRPGQEDEKQGLPLLVQPFIEADI